MSKKRKKNKYKQSTKKDETLLLVHSETNDNGFIFPEESTICEDEPVNKRMSVDEFDVMYTLLCDKYGSNPRRALLPYLIKKEFNYVITLNEIDIYMDVTLADDIKDKRIMNGYLQLYNDTTLEHD